MAIYLVRHGVSEGNQGRVMQGRRDYPLAPRGREQARALADWLGRQGVAPSVIYTSPLKRAHETAQLLAAGLDSPPVTACPELVEICAGDLEGLTIEEVDSRYPSYATRTLDERGDFSAYGGESYQSVQERLARFIEHVQGSYAGEDILAIGHGGSFYQLVKLWCVWPTPRHVFMRLTNCCCYKLELREIDGQTFGELRWFVPLGLITPELAEPPADYFKPPAPE